MKILGPPLRFTHTTYNATVENNRVVFNCTFDGIPRPDLTWRFSNGSSLPDTSQFQVKEKLKRSLASFM